MFLMDNCSQMTTAYYFRSRYQPLTIQLMINIYFIKESVFSTLTQRFISKQII